jgi:hypothetical protein
MLPIDLRNSRKAPFTSEPLDTDLPASILPLTTDLEHRLVSAMMTELNEEFGLSLDTNPDLNRQSDPGTAHSAGRTVVVGASHMRRTAELLIASGCTVTDLSAPGWTPSKENLKEISDYLAVNRLGGGG